MTYVEPLATDDNDSEAIRAETMEEQTLRANGIDPHMLTPMQRGQILYAIQDGQLSEGVDVGNLGIALARDPNALNKAIDPAAEEEKEKREREEKEREEEQAREAERRAREAQRARSGKNMQAMVAAMAVGMSGFITAVEDVPHNELFSPSHGAAAGHMQQRGQGASMGL